MLKKFMVSYADFQVKDFGDNAEAAKDFVKDNGGVVFEITPEKATGIADSQGDMHHTYTARNK